MSYRNALPQLEGHPFLTDGGLETDLIFHHGVDLPEFAAFDLLKDEEGTALLRSYFEPYARLARDRGVGFVLETPTWRASKGWGGRIGYSEDEVAEANRRAVALMEEIRSSCETEESPFVISGCIGPEGDGYDPEHYLSADAAEAYHRHQVQTFAETAADLVTAMTLTYPQEAIGIVRAARAAGMPVAISFTLETDGRLPNGQELADALAQVKEETGGGPDYFMLNCAHPTHFAEVVADAGDWAKEIRGLRANASTRSHAELDEAEDLDDGDPEDLARRYRDLRASLPRLTILGGCCGTDFRHVEAISEAWQSA
jgi:S-methylmethionine-dependent homocysteine/selenocysteine methylase